MRRAAAARVTITCRISGRSGGGVRASGVQEHRHVARRQHRDLTSDPVYDERPRTTTTRQSQGTIPVGQEIDVRIQTELASDTAQVEDRFEATTVVDLYQGDRVIVPAGSVMRGLVTSVNRASRTTARAA